MNSPSPPCFTSPDAVAWWAQTSITSSFCIKQSRDFEVFLWSLPELQLHLVLTALKGLHWYSCVGKGHRLKKLKLFVRWVKRGTGKLLLPAELVGNTPEGKNLGWRCHWLLTRLLENWILVMVMLGFGYRCVCQCGCRGDFCKLNPPLESEAFWASPPPVAPLPPSEITAHPCAWCVHKDLGWVL